MLFLPYVIQSQNINFKMFVSLCIRLASSMRIISYFLNSIPLLSEKKKVLWWYKIRKSVDIGARWENKQDTHYSWHHWMVEQTQTEWLLLDSELLKTKNGFNLILTWLTSYNGGKWEHINNWCTLPGMFQSVFLMTMKCLCNMVSGHIWTQFSGSLTEEGLQGWCYIYIL